MKFYPIIVVGGGVSGSAAAMYAARLILATLVFAEQPGGLITTTHLVENYPGIKSISGPKWVWNSWSMPKKQVLNSNMKK